MTKEVMGIKSIIIARYYRQSLNGAHPQKRRGMNLTYLRLELRRILRDVASLFFIVVLPAFLYIIFGASQSYGDEMIVSGNVTMYIMTSMAAYAAVTSATGIGGIVAIDRKSV